MNFYDMDSVFEGKKFDTMIFGSSFMIMPDQVKAIELAKSKKCYKDRPSVKERENILPLDPL